MLPFADASEDDDALTIRAVLFDVGGPIDTEVRHEQLVERDIAGALASVGIACRKDELAAASEAAVASFAPFAYAAMVWTLCGSDARLAGSAVARLHAPEATERRYNERGGIELRPGIGELLRGLHRRGLLLGLAANQPLRVIEELDRHDLGSLFSHREVSAHHGFRKPDTRLFLRACLDLGVPPGECIMVGDRIDNDIFPARLLGMRTVLFRTGRHINQQPRSGDDVPDAVAWTVDDLAEAIDSLIEAEG